ncbi:unnamed protein product [Menidia menidia]|uniref:(Atlantic silverside) hypothetical protein n=1 Tax=Menidia menidia TaxID=238744 RepID=A0A8S4AMI1_9TELE|nr:unnamed protein product [Menidia menidia]
MSILRVSYCHRRVALFGIDDAAPTRTLPLGTDRKLALSTRSSNSKMSGADVEEFLQQNRDTATQVETFRGYWESNKQWEARREFILRNLSDYEDVQMDNLLSLSMVWANNVFLGCRIRLFNGRYNTELLEKVKEMADGIIVDDAPIFKTRDEIMKNQKGR